MWHRIASLYYSYIWIFCMWALAILGRLKFQDDMLLHESRLKIGLFHSIPLMKIHCDLSSGSKTNSKVPIPDYFFFFRASNHIRDLDSFFRLQWLLLLSNIQVLCWLKLCYGTRHGFLGAAFCTTKYRPYRGCWTPTETAKYTSPGSKSFNNTS